MSMHQQNAPDVILIQHWIIQMPYHRIANRFKWHITKKIKTYTCLKQYYQLIFYLLDIFSTFVLVEPKYHN
jgi:hypothetical protein